MAETRRVKPAKEGGKRNHDGLCADFIPSRVIHTPSHPIPATQQPRTDATPPVPATQKPHHLNPQHFFKHQRCVICGSYPVIPKEITPPKQDDTAPPRANNLLPVCDAHYLIPLPELYASHLSLFRWLMEHDRADAAGICDRYLLRRRRTPAWKPKPLKVKMKRRIMKRK